jgi:hypothetical protein
MDTNNVFEEEDGIVMSPTRRRSQNIFLKKARSFGHASVQLLRHRNATDSVLGQKDAARFHLIAFDRVY